MDYLLPSWKGSTVGKESTIHQLSPYLGKMKSQMANSLITTFSKPGDFICDPFSGSGTVAFEGWALGRRVFANDLNPYAVCLTRAKLSPPRNLSDALTEFENLQNIIAGSGESIDLRTVPRWVRLFFNNETLREILVWRKFLLNEKSYFLLACLLGILHHQRPGFLSFPSSHAVPYLRNKKFPIHDYPELYTYRDVSSRLRKKIERAFRRVPNLDYTLSRTISNEKAELLKLEDKVDLILTSPPYMRNLDYARDNRLRLWMLGISEWEALDQRVSPDENAFLNVIQLCFQNWSEQVREGGHCILVVGNMESKNHKKQLPELIVDLATAQNTKFQLAALFTEEIPQSRRIRRSYKGSIEETIIIFRRREQ
ncbi:MAG: DNA adenine methylase [Anaerolineales bacterium]|nr:DNA adenine methylase [Anaerolineales bacterium]MCW5854447.1 DNA adenine methylase [Anaerolineales bacterium]